MNRFVVILPENYDEYSPLVPHPIETESSLDDLMVNMRDFFDQVLASREANPQFWWQQAWNVPGSTAFSIDFTDMALQPGTSEGLRHSYVFDPPKILTIDEWFSSYKNQKINDGVV